MDAFLLLLSLIFHFYSSVSDSSLQEGYSLSVNGVLVSPTGVFSARFYPVGDNAYCFSIWFTEPSCNRDSCTIVWMANRDFPVNGVRSKLWLQTTGNLVLTDAGPRSIAWSTHTASLSSTELILLDTGNLVLRSLNGVILWQSFDSPTNTLLPSQRFNKDVQLVSSRTPTNFSSGFYKLFFDNDNLLRLLYDDSEVTSVYWPTPWLPPWLTNRFPYNSSRFAFLYSLGKFTSSDNLSFVSADYGVRLQRRLALDFDGNLRLYSRKEDNTTWVVSWQALSQPCRIHGACGPNSVCNYDPVSGRRCSCLPGYQEKNANDLSSGCESKFNNISSDNDTYQTRFIRLSHVEFYGYDHRVYYGYTLDMCRNLCLSLSDCKGFQYRYLEGGLSLMKEFKLTDYFSACYPKVLLLNGRRSPNVDTTLYLKVSKNSLLSNEEEFSEFGLNCSDEILRPLERAYPKSSQNEQLQLILLFAIALGAVEITGSFLVWCFMFSSSQNSNEASQGYHHHHPEITGFRRFTYSELKKATGNFSVEIGRGARGTVYKATLPDNRIAAIKRLNSIANQGEAEFLAEVSIIGKLNHMNLIEMWGYCAERNQRLLVYEYMEHGSLAESLSSRLLDWPKRFQIALGIARGLAYLHEECLEWVLHCDVKPQNILLDSNYQPKVSDFGLSKMLNRSSGHLSDSSFSRIRGTRGYMAPEWVSNLPITSKVDVYSYGIVVLEIITGKSPANGESSSSGEGKELQRGLVTWVTENKKNEGESWMKKIIDPTLKGEYDKGEMEIIAKLAMQCVKEDRNARPAMSKVVEILLHRSQYSSPVKIDRLSSE